MAVSMLERFALASAVIALGGRACEGRSAMVRPPAKPKPPRSATTKTADGERWHAPRLVEGIAVEGGLLTKPTFVPTIEFDGEKYTQVDKRTVWLCQSVAGKCRSACPLSRTTVLETLRQLVEDATKGEELPQQREVDAMAGFGLDDESVVVPRGRGRVRGTSTVTVELPPRLRGVGPEVTSVVCLSRHPKNRGALKSVLLQARYVPWLMGILRYEVDTGGVDFEPQDTNLVKPYWSHRLGAWQCRAKTPGGAIKRKQVTVPERTCDPQGLGRLLSASEYAALKRQRLEEIEEWREQVVSGLLGD